MKQISFFLVISLFLYNCQVSTTVIKNEYYSGICDNSIDGKIKRKLEFFQYSQNISNTKKSYSFTAVTKHSFNYLQQKYSTDNRRQSTYILVGGILGGTIAYFVAPKTKFLKNNITPNGWIIIGSGILGGAIIGYLISTNE